MKSFAVQDAPAYPSEMRTQLWPLCCGASIISGFKSVGSLTHDQLVKQMTDIINNYTPDNQVFKGEAIRPKLVFLTLNSSQMQSDKLMKAVEAVGFKKFAKAFPRGSGQGFFFYDASNTFELITDIIPRV